MSTENQLAALQKCFDKLTRRCGAIRALAAAYKTQRDAARGQLLFVSDDLSGGRYCGCYVLMAGDRPLYVGQSVNVFARIANHRSKASCPTRGAFDGVRIFWCSADTLNATERRLIEDLQPAHNSEGIRRPYKRRTQAVRVPAELFGPGFSAGHAGVAP